MIPVIVMIAVIGIASTVLMIDDYSNETQSLDDSTLEKQSSQESAVETSTVVQTIHGSSHIYPLDVLAKGTKYAIIGTVKEITPVLSQYDEKKKMVFSDISIKVERDLNGEYEGKTITVRIQGGEKDGYKTITDFNAEFELDERILIFVPEKEPESIWGDNYYVAGLQQGKFSLVDGQAYGVHYRDGIGEQNLVSAIQTYRGTN